ncbi:hypothetical protein ONZ43_g116 [Nemania bipapillata]|uniref:Uncharacterized protein n=1 Tax=Nemania bipapillata TaxID=110536 RepID=A0ACC2J9G6_9PEZI|nr:hypothetical protein ONZ43_g116 [Nemania bipapillata]
MLRTRRDGGRKKINAGYDAYISAKKKEIGEQYAAETKKRSTEAKALLTRYVEALEQRASIEKSIEELVVKAREDLEDLAIILEATYSGRQQQCAAAVGSFDSIEDAPAKDAAVGKDTIFDIQAETQEDTAEKNCAADSTPQNEEQGQDDIFGQISW